MATRKLGKGMKFRLEKDGDLIKNARATITWDVPEEYNKIVGGRRPKFDADMTSALMQVVGKDADNKPVINVLGEDEANVAYYGNIEKGKNSYTTPNGEIFYSGDDQHGITGETHEFHFDKMSKFVNEIPLVCTIHKGAERGQNWDKLNAKLVIENIDSGDVIAEYDMAKDVGHCTAFHAGSFYFDADGNVEFQAIGQGYPEGTLSDFFDAWEREPVIKI